jgi:hypothetical protein
MASKSPLEDMKGLKMQLKQLNNLENNNMDSTQTTDKCRCCKNLFPLTNAELERLVDDEDWYNDPHGFARAIEAAHGICKGEA